MSKREKVCILLGLWIAFWLGSGAFADAGSKGEDELVPVKIVRVGMEPTSGQAVVILANIPETQALVIWIGHFEANAISSEIQGVAHPRPLTHDLLDHVIREAGFNLRRVVITHLADSTYHATMEMEKGGTAMDMDARPSDSLVMALKFQAPVFVSRPLFREKAVSLREEPPEMQYGFSLQELTAPLAQAFSFPEGHGVLVSDVREGGLAHQSGLERGDIVLEVDGNAVRDLVSAREALDRAGTALLIKVFREGKYMDLHLPAPETE
jgi:hypothetical protein